MSEKSSTNSPGVNDQFVSNLTKYQNPLYAYILSLLPDPEKARDILQETNLVMWRKAEEFEVGTSFRAWACKIAYFEVLTARRKSCRDRHFFNDQVISTLASEMEPKLAELDERSKALDECLEKLNAQQRAQLLERYGPGGSVRSMADARGETRGSIATALYRIRNALEECIRGKLTKGSV